MYYYCFPHFTSLFNFYPLSSLSAKVSALSGEARISLCSHFNRDGDKETKN